MKNNNKKIEKNLRREAFSKNWKLFKQSRLGMVGLYIVFFLLFFHNVLLF